MLTSFWSPFVHGFFVLWLFGWLPVKPPQWLTGGASVETGATDWRRLLFLFLLATIPLQLLTWIETTGLRRRSSLRDIPVMLRLVLATKRGRVTFIPMLLGSVITVLQTSLGAYHKRIGLLVFCLAIMIFLLPPGALVLGSSSRLSDRFFKITKRLMHPVRVVSLLEGNLFSVLALPGSGLDNLRTINSAKWRLVVHQLIEITPLVIVDARFPTPLVCEEITHLLDERRVSKTIFVVNEDGSAPAIEETGVNMTDFPLMCCPARDLHIAVTRFRNMLEIAPVSSKQA
jgi:hypothetical protein